MTRRDFIITTLIKWGIRTSLKGFDQFCECVELYSDDRSTTMDRVYMRVADMFGCTKSSVEKNVRRLFAGAGSGAMSGLIGAALCDISNKELVAMFSSYLELNRAEYDAVS